MYCRVGRAWSMRRGASSLISLVSASLATGRQPLCRAGRPSRDLGFLIVSPLELWLCFRPSAPAVADLSSCDSRLCFDSKLALFGAFLGRRHVVREALPDAIALSRLACRVRTFVGQDSILVVRRILNDTLRIVSHDRTGASLCHRLAALPFIAATRLLALLIPHLQFALRHLELTLRHLELALRHLAFVICHLPSVIRHLTLAIRLFAFPIPRSEFLLPHFSKGFERSQQLSVPGGLVAAVPLECRAAIQRRAVVPLGGLVCLDFLMLGQQLLEPADVPLDERADEDQRRSLIGGRRGDLAIGHIHETALIAHRQHISPVLPELVADAVAQRIEGMEEGIELRVEVHLDTALTWSPTNR